MHLVLRMGPTSGRMLWPRFQQHLQQPQQLLLPPAEKSEWGGALCVILELVMLVNKFNAFSHPFRMNVQNKRPEPEAEPFRQNVASSSGTAQGSKSSNNASGGKVPKWFKKWLYWSWINFCINVNSLQYGIEKESKLWTIKVYLF